MTTAQMPSTKDREELRDSATRAVARAATAFQQTARELADAARRELRATEEPVESSVPPSLR